MIITIILCDYLQVNISSTNTTQAVIGLNPFTNYACTLYATTVSNGPTTDPIIVRTAEQGTIQGSLVNNYTVKFNAFLLAPSPPLIRSLTVTDSESVLVEWNRPEELDGILTHYNITYVTPSDTNTIITPYNGLEVSVEKRH